MGSVTLSFYCTNIYLEMKGLALSMRCHDFFLFYGYSHLLPIKNIGDFKLRRLEGKFIVNLIDAMLWLKCQIKGIETEYTISSPHIIASLLLLKMGVGWHGFELLFYKGR